MVRRLITTVVVALMPLPALRALCDVNCVTTVHHDEPRAAAAQQLRI